MNWLKSKMGSHGWDLTEDDIKKPNILFLGPIEYAKQELEDFEEYFTVKIGPLDKELVSHLPESLSVISLPYAGYDRFDIDACTAR
ncbi:hypothetical protein BX616_007205, partial [Lobosporangium transversale]